MRWIVLLILGASAISSICLAQEERWTHYGLRPLAMGNAYVSVADDFNSLFYNPAGLARLKSWDGEFLNPYLEISSKTIDSVKSLQETLNKNSNSTKAIIELIEGEASKHHHAAVGITPHLIFRNFGFGIGFQLGANMIFHRAPSIALDIGPTLVVPFAFAFNTLEERLSIGIGLKLRARGGLDHEFSIEDLKAFDKNSSSGEPQLNDYVNGGLGFGGDFGILFTPSKGMEPTLGISVSDIGGTPYSKKLNIQQKAIGTPKPVSTSINTGFSLKPLRSGRSYLLTSVEMHSINQPFSFSKKLNLGAEWGFGELIKIQTGLHQGYLTGGFQFDVGLINLRFVSYAEELGAVAGSIQDRRYALQLKLLI